MTAAQALEAIRARVWRLSEEIGEYYRVLESRRADAREKALARERLGQIRAELRSICVEYRQLQLLADADAVPLASAIAEIIRAYRAEHPEAIPLPLGSTTCSSMARSHRGIGFNQTANIEEGSAPQAAGPSVCRRCAVGLISALWLITEAHDQATENTACVSPV
jgi:hypothetical protein